MAPKKKVSELKKLMEQRWYYPPKQKEPKMKFLSCGKSPNRGESKSYEPCWKSPPGMSTDVRNAPCWDYEPKRYKYFPPPPPCRGATVPPHILKPKFDHCETVYTRYDFRLEQCVHQQILFIEKLFKNLEQQLADSKAFQIEVAKRMRYLAVRRRLLLDSACGIKIYPEYLSNMTETRALCDFEKGRHEIKDSNSELAASVLEIRDALPELRKRLDKLDRTLETPFLSSIETVLQTIQDLYDFFFEVTRKYKTWAQMIDAAQEHSVEDYLALLRTEYDFESFKRAGLEECTCKRCRNNNPLEPYLPCWCQGCDKRKKTVDLLKSDITILKKYEVPLDISDSGSSEKIIDTPIETPERKNSDDD